MIIKNCKIFNGISFYKDYKTIVIENEKIVNIYDSIEAEPFDYNANHNIVCPGFIDIHTHGISGYDINNLEDMDYEKCVNEYIKVGTTSFLPSTVTQSNELTHKVLKSFSDYKSVIGIHLEAPFLNTEKKGAQNEKYIISPSINAYKELVGDYAKNVKRVTLAPELDDEFKLTKYLNDFGVLLSFGHTVCDSKLACEAFSKGFRLATHYMNAMPTIHHREPSITGMALINEDVYCELICDLLHVCEDMVKIIYKVKGSDKIVLVSDSMAATNLGDGIYSLGGKKVIVKNNSARLIEGNLAGSIITLADGVKKYINAGINVEDVLKCVTYNPAKLFGLEDEIGMIKINNYADILVLDKKYNVNKIIFRGKFK